MFNNSIILYIVTKAEHNKINTLSESKHTMLYNSIVAIVQFVFYTVCPVFDETGLNKMPLAVQTSI